MVRANPRRDLTLTATGGLPATGRICTHRGSPLSKGLPRSCLSAKVLVVD
jgi:hypothetical protein